ncbi:hypothetical protein [Anaerospora hongkongensis]|uniref:hypothetical protein n=1 Tax=Anaerospora hongkongensis TaxID=244830 RepID=UPI0028A164AE|nr:hypothetical protein [Anaerospora hongkongensis]
MAEQRVTQFIKQLEDLGYRSFQIDDIIRDAVGVSKIENLSLAQTQILEEALQDYVSFAFKCKGKKC